MKNISAKLKLTLSTGLLMSVMAIIVLLLLFSFSDNIIRDTGSAQLQKVITDNADELEYDDGRLDIEDIDFFKNNVYTLVYDTKGNLVYGDFPEQFNHNPPLQDKKISQISSGDSLYYIYDLLSDVEDYDQQLWLRGIILVDEVAEGIAGILRIALFALPAFIIVGMLGSYFIAKLTFKPIDQIVQTAEHISHSEDLSLRLNLTNSSREIQRLATTFDHMINRLENAFEAEKQFSQNVSHELRTPTAIILAQSEFGLDQQSNAADQQEALEVIQRQAGRMSRLIGELLALSRLERGLEKPQFSLLNLSELIQIICEEQSIIAMQNIELKADISPNIMLEGNRLMLVRMINNLLSNSYHYGRENGWIQVSLRSDGEQISLKIADNGIGIAKEDIPKIWQRFYQVDKARTTDNSGSMGLGLAMVLQIVKIHDAEIFVTSEPNHGSCFTIIFKKV